MQNVISTLDRPVKDQEDAVEMMRQFVNAIENELKNDPSFVFYTFGHKSFSLVRKAVAGWWEAPYCLCPFALKREFFMFVASLKKSHIDPRCFQGLLYELMVELVEFNVKGISI